MPWPTPQEYNEAIQNPRSAFADPDLASGLPELNQLGLPRPISGGFACVYKISSRGHLWAARCFLTEVTDQQERYRSIAACLAHANLPYTVPFTYQHAGIRVGGRNYPLLKMEWAQGETLGAFVQRNVFNPNALQALADQWVKMLGDLRSAGIAHGDLQHGNVLVTAAGLRLIDYDGMFVPALRGRQSRELGHRNYQHPSRTAVDYGPTLDNFSGWVVWLSLAALIEEPQLWGRFNGGDECLMFRRQDFADPAHSSLVRYMTGSAAPRLRAVTELFVATAASQPMSVAPIDVSAIANCVQAWEERQRAEAARLRRQQRIRTSITAAAAVFVVLVLLHLWLLTRTTLNFECDVDGRPMDSSVQISTTIDGRPFMSGDRMGIGRHTLVVTFPGGEEYTRRLWTVYGANKAGPLHLQTSKGALSVKVLPAPARLVLLRKGHAVAEGNTTLEIASLPVGTYSLVASYGEYRESHELLVNRGSTTRTNVQLEVGSLNLATSIPNTRISISSPQYHYEGVSPVKLTNIPAGTYQVVAERGEYREEHQIVVNTAKTSVADIELQLGRLQLTSSPSDAEYEVKGVSRTWEGRLPATIDDVPVGTYTVTYSRKGWKIAHDVSVSPSKTSIAAFHFPYGELRIECIPPGLIARIDGKLIGPTPAVVRELRPGNYSLSVSDGENEIITSVLIGDDEVETRKLEFSYGRVQLASTPTGAEVLRNGRKVGTTPLVMERVPTIPVPIILQAQGWLPKTIDISATERKIAAYHIVLTSKIYAEAVEKAKDALANHQFDRALEFAGTAVKNSPGGDEAIILQRTATQEYTNWKREQDEEQRRKEIEQAQAIAARLQAIDTLDPVAMLSYCWDDPKVPKLTDGTVPIGDVAKQNGVLATPVWAATDAIVVGINAIAWPFKKAKEIRSPRFVRERFDRVFRNTIVKYYGRVSKWDAKTQTLTFVEGGTRPLSYEVVGKLNSPSIPLGLQPGRSIWVSGSVVALTEGRPNRITLENCSLYPTAALGSK